MGKTCYIIGPIGKPKSRKRKWADFVMRQVIKPAVMECGYKAPQRSDKDLSQALITRGIIQQMLEADLIFVDLSYRNANAYYELGIRHCVQKPVIHLIKKKQSPLFDVKDQRVIYVGRDGKMILEAQEAIKKRIGAIETDPTQHYSDVQACMRGKEFDALSPEEKLSLARYRVIEMIKRREKKYASFVAIRNKFNPTYTDPFLTKLIVKYPEVFDTVRMKKYGPGIKLVGPRGNR